MKHSVVQGIAAYHPAFDCSEEETHCAVISLNLMYFDTQVSCTGCILGAYVHPNPC